MNYSLALSSRCRTRRDVAKLMILITFVEVAGAEILKIVVTWGL